MLIAPSSGLGMGLVRSFSGRDPVMVMFITRYTPDKTPTIYGNLAN